MKKYKSRATVYLAVLTLISIAIFTIGIVCICFSSNAGLQVVLVMSGGLMSVVFISCYFAEKSRTLIIDTDKIVFPRGTDVNGKMIWFPKAITTDEISSVESKLYKGDGLISRDTYFHTLKLKDGTKVTVLLYAYGKKAEKEILEVIRNRIK